MVHTHDSQTIQQLTTTFQPHQRVIVGYLKSSLELINRNPHQTLGIHLLFLEGREITLDKHIKRHHGETLGPIKHHFLAIHHRLVFPGISRTSVQQHRDDTKINQPTCDFQGSQVSPVIINQHLDSINLSGFEMAPSGVGRDL